MPCRSAQQAQQQTSQCLLVLVLAHQCLLITTAPWFVACCLSYVLQINEGVNLSTFPLGWASVYKVTFALAYLLVATFLVQFFLFWLCKSAFIDQATTTVVVESSKQCSGHAAHI